jgi:NitT/TauT family transport system substrate-binding protein
MVNHREGAEVAGLRVAPLLAGVLLLALACGPGAAPAQPTAATVSVPTASAAAAGPAGPSSAGPSKPTLATTPLVELKVGVLGSAVYGPHYIARERGYFQEVGISPEFTAGANVNQLLPALGQGQLQVGSCSNSIACFNAMQRGVDLRIVADLSSGGGPSPKSDSVAIVVRKDLWDAGTVREPEHLVGRQLYNIAGEGSGAHAIAARWLRTRGVDPRAVEWPQMTYPDILAAMQNRAIEVAVQGEPLLTAGEKAGAYVRMAGVREMHPTAHISYLMYHTSIDRLGPQVGERFMVALVRGMRDYVNAFEYGVDQQAIIDILVRETFLKDPEVYRQTGYAWVNPNAMVSLESLQGDADMFYELGVAAAPIDLSGVLDDHYRQLALQYLGEYQPPR